VNDRKGIRFVKNLLQQATLKMANAIFEGSILSVLAQKVQRLAVYDDNDDVRVGSDLT
jgi:predicted DNA-binding protein (UPF0251 family)